MEEETKIPDALNDGESLEFKHDQKDSFVKQEATIAGSGNQQTWQQAFDQWHANDPHPSEIKGLPAVQSSFGIDFGDGRILTAKGPTQNKKGSNWLEEIGDAVKEGQKNKRVDSLL